MHSTTITHHQFNYSRTVMEDALPSAKWVAKGTIIGTVIGGVVGLLTGNIFEGAGLGGAIGTLGGGLLAPRRIQSRKVCGELMVQQQVSPGTVEAARQKLCLQQPIASQPITSKAETSNAESLTATAKPYAKSSGRPCQRLTERLRLTECLRVPLDEKAAEQPCFGQLDHEYRVVAGEGETIIKLIAAQNRASSHCNSQQYGHKRQLYQGFARVLGAARRDMSLPSLDDDRQRDSGTFDDSGNSGWATCIGGRANNEDVISGGRLSLAIGDEQVIADYLAVYDGHSGSDCAWQVAKTYPQFLKLRMEQYQKHGLSLSGCHNALKVSATDTNIVVANSSAGLSSGCVALNVLLLPQGIWVSSTGDCRALLVLSGGAVRQLTADTRADSPEIASSISKRGGEVFYGRINGMLQPGRSFGDCHIAGVSARGKINYLERKSDQQILIIGCDGLFECASSKQIGAAAYWMKSRGYPAEKTARLLVHMSELAALEAPEQTASTMDNKTVVVRYL